MSVYLSPSIFSPLYLTYASLSLYIPSLTDIAQISNVSWPMKTRSALSFFFYFSLTLYPSLCLSLSLYIYLSLSILISIFLFLYALIMANPFSNRSTRWAVLPHESTLAIPFSVRGVPRLCRWADPMRMRRQMRNWNLFSFSRSRTASLAQSGKR